MNNKKSGEAREGDPLYVVPECVFLARARNSKKIHSNSRPSNLPTPNSQWLLKHKSSRMRASSDPGPDHPTTKPPPIRRLAFAASASR